MKLVGKFLELMVKKTNPESFELVKPSKNGRNVYAKIYTRALGKAKRKVSALVEMADKSKKRVSISLEELSDERDLAFLDYITHIWAQLNP